MEEKFLLAFDKILKLTFHFYSQDDNFCSKQQLRETNPIALARYTAINIFYKYVQNRLSKKIIANRVNYGSHASVFIGIKKVDNYCSVYYKESVYLKYLCLKAYKILQPLVYEFDSLKSKQPIDRIVDEILEERQQINKGLYRKTAIRLLLGLPKD